MWLDNNDLLTSGEGVRKKQECGWNRQTKKRICPGIISAFIVCHFHCCGKTSGGVDYIIGTGDSVSGIKYHVRIVYYKRTSRRESGLPFTKKGTAEKKSRKKKSVMDLLCFFSFCYEFRMSWHPPSRWSNSQKEIHQLILLCQTVWLRCLERL